jgi:hypothetical protein
LNLIDTSIKIHLNKREEKCVFVVDAVEFVDGMAV